MATKTRKLAAACCVSVLWFVPPASAQSAGVPARESVPPLHPVVALEATTTKLYRGLQIVLIATRDGAEHAYKFLRDLAGVGNAPEGFAGLREGTTVTIQYRIELNERAEALDWMSDDDLMVTEGKVVGLEPERKRITVACDDGATSVFQLVERVTALSLSEEERTAAARADGGDVVIRYSDENGRKVVHFFRRIP